MFDGTVIARTSINEPANAHEVPAFRTEREWATRFPNNTPDSPDEVRSNERSPTRHRTIWISDIHLGTPGCQSEALLEFLRDNESDTLYLVGDIVDGWALRRRWFWHQSHNDVVQKVLRKVRKGTKVVFIAGNHDEAARQFLGLSFGGILIADEIVHTMANGKRFLVTHGDQFDGVIRCAKWLAYLGDSAYELSLKINRVLNFARRRVGLPYWSLSHFLKHRVKNAVSYITAFEEAVAEAAKRRGLQGVVCGHIHRPEIRDIDGITYCNDGDWVESLSALVEDYSGRLRILALDPSAYAASHRATAESQVLQEIRA